MSSRLTTLPWRGGMLSKRIVSKIRVSSQVRDSVRSSSSSSLAELPPLDQPLPGVELKLSDLHRTDVKRGPTFQLTTLENGVKVASEDSFGQFCTIGAVIDAGSRNEIDYPSGITHMLEKLAFQSTQKYADFDSILQAMERLGGHIDCQIFRDCGIYAASAYKFNVAGTLDVLSEAVWSPNITPEEVEEQKQTVAFELENLDYRADCEPQLTDLVHSAAFAGNTVGLPKICPAGNLDKMDADKLWHFMKRYYRPERITIAGVNVDHDELVKTSREKFVSGAPSWTREPPAAPTDHSIAQYTGGERLDHRDGPRLQPGHTQLPELVHISLGFESADYTEPEMFAFAVLNSLLGGGGAFSAGGPGKGMYTRLYRNVLNIHHFLFSSIAFNHSYADSGLFCIHTSAPPEQATDLLNVITQEYCKLVDADFHAEEVARAKKQLQSTLIMNLESRVVRFEDIGRQVLGLGERKSPTELYDSIERVTAGDLRRAAERMLASKPALAATGNLKRMPAYDDVVNALHKRTAIRSGLKKFWFNR